jgi:hypothetical protein
MERMVDLILCSSPPESDDENSAGCSEHLDADSNLSEGSSDSNPQPAEVQF